MLIQWCLKGVPYRQDNQNEQGNRDEKWVRAVLGGDAITSAWLRGTGGTPMPTFPSKAEAQLSPTALDDHVHNYPKVCNDTPYISLSAGCVERVVRGVTIRHSALRTALSFATGSGQYDGWIFLCWVHVAPKPAPELPGMAEEVRNLNLFSTYSIFHEEGEIAAKLFVPSRQIRSATLFRSDLSSGVRIDNPQFVEPERVSNILGLV